MQYYEISEETARRAHEMCSMSDYRPGNATASYRASVDKAAALVTAQKTKISPYYHDKLDALLDSYARRLAQWTNDHNRNGASCPSVLICGPANFPTRKKQRQNAREETLWAERKTIDALLDKIRTIGSGPVDLADPHAREMLQDKLQQLQALLDRDKAMNAYYRKHKTFAGFPGIDANAAERLTATFADTRARCPWVDKPFPDYELTSLRGKIKRVQARLVDLDKLQATAQQPDNTTGDGWRIVRNAEQNRLQILFDDKPDEGTRAALKANGFRWSPRNSAWQRQLTENGKRAALQVMQILDK